MIRPALLLAAIALAAPATAAAPHKPARAPATPHWENVVTRLPSGAFRIGNPAAKLKIIEYLSMTCPHCAHFAIDGLPILRRDYIAKGTVSIELRHAVRDGFDFAATLLASCGGTSRYLADFDAIFRAQQTWEARTQGFTVPTVADPATLPVAFARAAGLDALIVARGVPAARVAACLSNKAEQARYVAMRTEAFETRNLQTVPAFLINDSLTGAYNWDSLKPMIDALLR